MSTIPAHTITRALVSLVVLIAATLALSTNASAKGRHHRGGGKKVVKTTVVKQKRGRTKVTTTTKVVHRGNRHAARKRVVTHRAPRVVRARPATRLHRLPAGARLVRVRGRSLYRAGARYYRRIVLPGGLVRFDITLP